MATRITKRNAAIPPASQNVIDQSRMTYGEKGPLKELNAERDLSQLIYNKCVDKDDKLDMSKLDLAKQPLKAAEAPVKTNLIEDILLNKKTTKDDSHRTRVTNRKTTPGEISI